MFNAAFLSQTTLAAHFRQIYAARPGYIHIARSRRHSWQVMVVQVLDSGVCCMLCSFHLSCWQERGQSMQKSNPFRPFYHTPVLRSTPTCSADALARGRGHPWTRKVQRVFLYPRSSTLRAGAGIRDRGSGATNSLLHHLLAGFSWYHVGNDLYGRDHQKLRWGGTSDVDH